MEKKQPIKKDFLKWIAGLTLQALILSNLFFTSPTEIFAQDFSISASLKFPETFLKFPADLGKFETFSLPQGSSDRTFIYVIQDAHGSLEAQENIFKILTFLQRKGQLDLLLLEGAAGSLTAARLDPFKEEMRNAHFVEALSRQGLVNGAVRFFASEPRVAAYGMEDPALYRKNLETYRAVLGQRGAIRDFLNRGEVSLMESTKRILDPKVMLFLKRWKIQQERGGDFGEYLKFLLDYASRSLKVDWHDYALQQDWPQLVRIFYLLNTDLKRDYPKLEKEIKMLRRSLGAESSSEMEWLQRTVEADSLSSHDFRDTVTSPRLMTERLIEKAQDRNVPWVRYPALTRFLSCQIFKNEIISEDLFNEIQILERKIFESLSRDPRAGAWMEFYQDFYLLKQALSLELRRGQIERFREHFKGSWLKSFERFLGKKDLPQEKAIAPLVEKILEFYVQAEARESAFFSELSRKIPAEGVPFHSEGGLPAVKHLVIITGGYHKEGLKRKIDLCHIPYGVITPRLESEDNLLPYQKLMMGDYAEIATLAPAQIPVMRDPAVAQQMIGSRAFLNFQTAFQRTQNAGVLTEQHFLAPSPARSEVRSPIDRRVFTVLLLGSLFGLPCAAQIKILHKGRDKAREDIKTDRNFVLPSRDEPLPPAIVVDEYSLASKLLANDPVVQKARYEITIQQAGKGRLAKSISIRPSLGIVDGKPLLGLGVEAAIPNVGSVGMGGFAIGNAASVVVDFATLLSNYLKGKDLFAKELAEQMVEIARFDQQAVLGERYLYYLKLAFEIKTFDEQIPIAEGICKSLDHALEISLKNRQITEEKRQALRDQKSAWLLRLNTFQSASKKAKSELLNLYAPGAIGETKFMFFMRNTILPDDWEATVGKEAAVRIKATQKSGAEFPANRALARSYAARLAAITAARVAGIKDGFTFGLGGFSFADPYGSNPPDNFHTLVLHDAEERDHNARAISSNGNLTLGGKASVDKNVAILKVSVADAELQAVTDRISMRISELLRVMEENVNALKVLQAHNKQLDEFVKKASSQGALTEDHTVSQTVEIEENKIKISSARQAISLAVQEILVLTWDFKGGLPKPLNGGRSEMRSNFEGEESVMMFAATLGMGAQSHFASKVAQFLRVFTPSPDKQGKKVPPNTIKGEMMAEFEKPEILWSNEDLEGFSVGGVEAVKYWASVFYTSQQPDVERLERLRGIFRKQLGRTHELTIAAHLMKKMISERTDLEIDKLTRADLKKIIEVLQTAVEDGRSIVRLGGSGRSLEQYEQLEFLADSTNALKIVLKKLKTAYALKNQTNIPRSIAKVQNPAAARSELRSVTPARPIRSFKSRLKRLIGIGFISGFALLTPAVSGSSPVAIPRARTSGTQPKTKVLSTDKRQKVAVPQSPKTVTQSEKPKVQAEGPAVKTEGPAVQTKEPTAAEAAMDAEYKVALAAFIKETLDRSHQEDERMEADTVHFDSLEDLFTNKDKIDAMLGRSDEPRDARVSRMLGRPVHVDWQGFVRYDDEIPTVPAAGSREDLSTKRVVEIREGDQKQTNDVAGGQGSGNGNILTNPTEFLPLNWTANGILSGPVGLLPGVVQRGSEGDQKTKPQEQEGEDQSQKPILEILTGDQVQGTRGDPIERSSGVNLSPKTVTGIPVAEQGEGDHRIPPPKHAGEDLSQKSVMEILTGDQGQGTRGALPEQPSATDLSKKTVTEILAVGQGNVEGNQGVPTEKQAAKDFPASSPPPNQRTVSLPKTVPSRAVVPKVHSGSSRAAAPRALSEGNSPRIMPASALRLVPLKGEILYAGSGQANVNPSGAIALRVPFRADNMAYAVKPGDIVKKGDLLVRASDTERENRIRFLESRVQEIESQIADGEKNPGTLDRDTLLQYRFNKTEFELELFRFRAEEEADALFSPRSAVIQVLPLGPAADGGYTMQIVPLDEGVIKIKLPPHYSSADDVVLSVNGKPVTVLDWEASGFDLAEGPEGEFVLTVHFISQASVTQGNREAACRYDIQLIKRDSRDVEAAGIHHKETGFHTLVPPSPFIPVGVSPVPGVGAGVFHAAVRDGQMVQAGAILGEVSIPGVHEGETQKVGELVQRANDFRRANNDFNTLPESTLQGYDARATRERAGLERSGSPVLVRAPVSGRVQGVTNLDGQMLALGRMTEAGIRSEEIFLGTSTDPRSNEWSGRLSSNEPYLIPVKRGTIKRGNKVSVITTHGVLEGTVYAVIPLANNGFELFTTLDGVILQVVDGDGILGEGSAVDIAFDNGAGASKWARRGESAPQRLAPPLRIFDEIPAAVREELQMHPGKKIGIRRMLGLAMSEQNIQQKFAILKYFSGAFGFRYLGWLAAALIAGVLAIVLVPKLLYVFVRNRSYRHFFRQKMVDSLQELRFEMEKIEMNLNRKAHNRNIAANLDPDKKVILEIVEPINEWIRLLWEHEDLGSEEYATIMTKAGELAANEFLRFSQEHFEDLAEQWKNDTRYQVKIRGILTRLCILSGKMAVAHLERLNADQKEVDFREFLRFMEKITDHAEHFNEGYNLAHRLIALSQVIELYPPKLVRGNSPLKFSEWLAIVKNRIVIWTFPILRFFLGVSVMVMYNRRVALTSAKKVFINTHRLKVFGFTSVEEAMKAAKKGLNKAFNPVALVDEFEGNKLYAYYGRWLGRLLVLSGVVIAIQAPLIFAIFGLTPFVAQGFGLAFQLFVPSIAIWRHVGPMIIKLRGEGYGVWRDEIRGLKRAAKQMNRKLPKTSPFEGSQDASVSSASAVDSLEDEIPNAATVTPEEAKTFARLVLDQIPPGMTLEEAMREPGAAQKLDEFFESVLREARATTDPDDRAKKIRIIEQFLGGGRSEMRTPEKQDWGIVAAFARRALERNARLMPELRGYIIQNPNAIESPGSPREDLPQAPSLPVPRRGVSSSSSTVNLADEELIMLKMREVLLDDNLRESVEVVVLVPPQHGENKRFFEGMVSQDKILQRFHFIVKESDGLFPGTAGQVFAARGLVQSPEKKIKIYWFPQEGIPFPVAISLFTTNLAEALRMAGDFKTRGMKYGEIIYPGGDLSSNIIHYSKNGSNIVIDARLASLDEVQKHRYPVLLGRNGSPRHHVEHVVRRPEELQGAVSQYGYETGGGLNIRNKVVLQFPVPKGPLALVSNNEEEYQQMRELLDVFLKKTEELTERYGAFWVDFVEDFAGVIAEFHHQLKENDSVPPSLERLVHEQKKFPDGQKTANPYGKIYQVIGQTLWAHYTEGKKLPEVESFIPPPTALLFVPGDDHQQMTRQLEHMGKRYPGLVNTVALERLRSGGIPDEGAREFLFRYSPSGEILRLPRNMGHERKYSALVSAAFLIKDGKLLFQRRSRLAPSNPGLLDLPVVEHQEKGETPEAAVRRGFIEELFDGRPLPLSLSGLSFQAIADTSYEVNHERRRQVPGTVKEEASVFLASLNSEFSLDEFFPGDHAVEVVSLSPGEVERMYTEQRGRFTARTYVMLKQFFPQINASITSPDHGESMDRSEARTIAAVSRGETPARSETGIVSEVSRKASMTSLDHGEIPARSKSETVAMIPQEVPFERGPIPKRFVQEAVREESPAVPDEIRILTAILMAKKILAYQDRALFPRLEASLKNSAKALSQVLPSLTVFLGFDASNLTLLRGRIETLMKKPEISRQTADNKVLFLDGGILSEGHFSKFAGSDFPMVFAFDRNNRRHYEQISQKYGRTLSEKRIFIVYAPDGLSSFIKQALKAESDSLRDYPALYRLLSRFQGQDKAQDMAFIARDRNESKKLETHYVGHRYYYGPELLQLDPELVFYSIQLLLRSAELFKNGQGRDGQSVETFLGTMLRQILEASQTERHVSVAA